MIRVLQVISGLGYGGVASAIMNYYRVIDRTKVQFDFTTTAASGRLESEILSLGGKIFRLPVKSRHPFRYMRELKKIIKENNYDVVHSNTNSASAFLDLLPAKCAGCKIRIAHSHASSSCMKLQHRFFKPLLHVVATHRFACSESAAKWLFGKSKDFYLIKNGFDFNKFAYNESVRQDIRIKNNWENQFVLGHIGAFAEWKNQRFLINMMPKLLQKDNNMKLVLIGSGPTYQEMQEFARSLEVENNVVFLGNRSDVYELLNGFDMFLFPSLFEGLGIAYVEAIANGLPVLVSDKVPIIQELHHDALFRAPLDESVWVEKIIETRQSPLKRNIFSIEQRKALGYDIKHLAEDLVSIYEKIVGDNK